MSSEYEKCLVDAQQRYDKGKLKLCPRGYCTAKQKFEVYPSAYANGYAVQVCKGSQPDFLEETTSDQVYTERLSTTIAEENHEEHEGQEDHEEYKEEQLPPLQRWFAEEWVNVCEKGNAAGGYKECGSGNGVDDPANYPYCRPYYKKKGTTIVTAQELTADEIATMCQVKRSQEQGVDGRPTRVYLEDTLSQGSESGDIEIPADVQSSAMLGLEMMENGYKGGTQTGWDRASQLANDGVIDTGSLADMRTWFARHGPDARNGGTSYPGYCKWLADGSPMEGNYNAYKGAVSWLIWGGDEAYRWLKTPEIRAVLTRDFPTRKQASADDNLGC